MRDLKAKTIRAVARSSPVPAETRYGEIRRRVAVKNPFYTGRPGEPEYFITERVTVVLKKGCQRAYAKWLKKRVGKNTFFGAAVRAVRTGAVTVNLPAREPA